MRKHLAVIIILVASIAVHFAFFGYPRQTVFDEVHFGKFVSGYFTHEYFFDIHPPLGKLIIAGAAKMADFQPGFSFGQIGEEFPDGTYRAMRLLPSLAGVLLPLVIYLLALQLGFSKQAAFAAGILTTLDNALLVQSRFILLDAFLLLFGFSAWLFYALYRNKGKQWYFFVAIILAALALSVKWTGATFLGIMGILEIIRYAQTKSPKQLGLLASMIIVPFVIYYGIFAIHLGLLNKSGPGDGFMTPQFRKTLAGSEDSTNPNVTAKGMFGKFVELNEEMYRSNARLTAGHPYSSKWYTWPFMERGIYYWNDAGNSSARIYLLGNPLVWWASTFGILFVLLSTWSTKRKPIIFLLTGAYLVNLLPFIGITRAMFLYHYFTGLIIAILALVYAVDQLKHSKKVFVGLLVASLALFLFFAPLSYGKPLSSSGFENRMWFKSWR